MGAMVVAHPQVLRHAAHPIRVVVTDHEEAQEDHRRDGADPVPMIRPHAIFGAVGGVPHHFQGAEVRGHERDAGDPM